MLMTVQDVNNAIKFHFSQYSKADISVADVSPKIGIFNFGIFCLFKLPVFVIQPKVINALKT